MCVVCGSNDRTLSPAASSRVRRARPRGTTLGHTHSNTMWATTITTITTNTRYASEAHRLKYFAGHHHQQHAGQGSTITSLFSSPASSFILVLLILLTFGLLVRHVAGDHPSLCPPLFFVRSPKKGYGMVWYGMVWYGRPREEALPVFVRCRGREAFPEQRQAGRMDEWKDKPPPGKVDLGPSNWRILRKEFRIWRGIEIKKLTRKILKEKDEWKESGPDPCEVREPCGLAWPGLPNQPPFLRLAPGVQ